VGHIPTKLYKFLISSFEILCGQTDRRTDRRRQKQYRSQRSWRAGKQLINSSSADMKEAIEVLDRQLTRSLLTREIALSNVLHDFVTKSAIPLENEDVLAAKTWYVFV